MPAQNETLKKKDSENMMVVIIALVVALFFGPPLLWKTYHGPLSHAYVILRDIEFAPLTALMYALHWMGLDWLAARIFTLKSGYGSYADFSAMQVSDIRNSTLWFDGVLCAVLVFFAARAVVRMTNTHPYARFKRSRGHTLASFVKEQAELYPHLKMFGPLSDTFIDKPLDDPLFGMSLTPRQFAEKHGLIGGWRRENNGTYEPIIDRDKAEAAFTEQLGAPWTGVDALSPSETLVFAILIPRIAATRGSLPQSEFAEAMDDSRKMANWCWQRFSPKTKDVPQERTLAQVEAEIEKVTQDAEEADIALAALEQHIAHLDETVSTQEAALASFAQHEHKKERAALAAQRQALHEFIAQVDPAENQARVLRSRLEDLEDERGIIEARTKASAAENTAADRLREAQTALNRAKDASQQATSALAATQQEIALFRHRLRHQDRDAAYLDEQRALLDGALQQEIVDKSAVEAAARDETAAREALVRVTGKKDDQDEFAWVHPVIDLAEPKRIIQKYLSKHDEVARFLSTGEDSGFGPMRHAFVRPLILAMIQKARGTQKTPGTGVVPSANMRWLRLFDRSLWYVVNNAGRMVAWPEAAGAFTHWQFEAKAGRAIRAPQMKKAVDALQVIVSSYRYDDKRVQAEIRPWQIEPWREIKDEDRPVPIVEHAPVQVDVPRIVPSP